MVSQNYFKNKLSISVNILTDVFELVDDVFGIRWDPKS